MNRTSSFDRSTFSPVVGTRAPRAVVLSDTQRTLRDGCVLTLLLLAVNALFVIAALSLSGASLRSLTGTNTSATVMPALIHAGVTGEHVDAAFGLPTP